MDNHLLEFPRKRLKVQMVGDLDVIFTGPACVNGVVFWNHDASDDGDVEFQNAAGTLEYLTYMVPKGTCLYLPIRFYAEDGLSLILGTASQCDATVFWVGRALND